MPVLSSAARLAPLLLVALAAGCFSPPKRNPIPADLIEGATVSGIPDTRYWADEAPPFIDGFFARDPADLREQFPAAFGKPHHYLAISGGGPRGAFGAGLLKGWAEEGSRPEFTMVTGISTGALIAPFAFLGPDYDHVIEEIYTRYATRDIVKPRSTLKIITGDAATSSQPIRDKLDMYISDEVVEALAEQSRRGRSLVIVTTNLDAGRPVAWDVDRIAASGLPGARELIRDIVLASASIPGAFPPVMFDVQADGAGYDELHVDGGATSVVHLYPLGVDWEALLEKLQVPGTPQVYVIRNGFLDGSYKPVDRSVIAITAKTVDTLMGSIVYGDMYRIYLATLRDGLEYNLAFVPEDFDFPADEVFDREYMQALFQVGYELGRDGYEWSAAPPGFVRE
jgi:hypothetical protein